MSLCAQNQPLRGGLIMETKHTHLTDYDKQTIRILKKLGYSYSKIETLTGRSRTTIYKILKEAGLTQNARLDNEATK